MPLKTNSTKVKAAETEVVGCGYNALSPNTHHAQFSSFDEKTRLAQRSIDDAYRASRQEALLMARAIIIDAMGGETNASPMLRETAQNGLTSVVAKINETISTLI